MKTLFDGAAQFPELYPLPVITLSRTLSNQDLAARLDAHQGEVFYLLPDGKLGALAAGDHAVFENTGLMDGTAVLVVQLRAL